MKRVNLKGIVLRNIDFKETSKICYVLTNAGILSIKALGIKTYKNKNFNFNEILNNCKMEITDSNFPSLINYELINPYFNIKKDVNKLSYVFMLLDVTLKLNGDLNYEKIYNFLSLILEKIEQGYDYKILCAIYLIKMLMPLGIKPVFDKCLYCKTKDVKFLNINEGYSLCYIHKMENSYEIEDIIKLYNFDLSNIDEASLNNLNINIENIYEFIFNYYAYHLEINLRKYKIK